MTAEPPPALPCAGETARLFQVTDPHLFADPRGILKGVNTRDALERVIGAMGRERPGPDLVVATGDIAQRGEAGAYREFIRQAGRLGAPWRWIPGNHDDPDAMAALGGEAGGRLARLNNWLVVLLDSVAAGEEHGELTRAELDFLESALAAAGGRADHCLVCLHHHPVESHAPWMKGTGLRGAGALWEVLSRFPSVRAVLHGHAHRAVDIAHRGVRCLCAPAACFQFGPPAGPNGPGWRSLELRRDGGFRSRARWAED